MAARLLVRGKVEKPKWVVMRDETTLVGVEIGHSEPQVLKCIWCTMSIWKSLWSLWSRAVTGEKGHFPPEGPGSVWAHLKEGRLVPSLFLSLGSGPSLTVPIVSDKKMMFH